MVTVVSEPLRVPGDGKGEIVETDIGELVIVREKVLVN